MCRSIKTLRGMETPPTEEEIRAAALQFVRKISGYREPSATNREAFQTAVDEITASSTRLLANLKSRPVAARGVAVNGTPHPKAAAVHAHPGT